MNWKAFVLGISLGFAVAVVPACGPASNCGPNNCAGCCNIDATGKSTCVAAPANTNNQTCGNAGNACTDCTKNTNGSVTCNAATFQCTGGTGGGSGGGSGGGTGGGSGGCNSSNCNGCCAGNACIPLNQTSTVNCGANGAACATCGGGQNCTAGACVTPDGGGSTGGVGDGCNTASDCPNVPTVSGGGPTQCKKNALVLTTSGYVNGYAYPGGFCTRKCTSSTQCGTDGRCMYFLGFMGEAENICVPKCASKACRQGYMCVNFGSTTSPFEGCIVAGADGGFMDEFDAGTPATDYVMGSACGSDGQCQPPASGECLTPNGLLPDGGVSPYQGGSCTADCTMSTFDEWCGADGGACVPSAFSSSQGPIVFWTCEAKCNPQATSTCRTGYVCDQVYTSLPDYGICIPNCNNAGFGACSSGTCNATSGKCE